MVVVVTVVVTVVVAVAVPVIFVEFGNEGQGGVLSRCGFVEQGFDLGVSPTGRHRHKFRVVVDAGHPHVGDVGGGAFEAAGDVVNVEDGFVVFRGEPDGHHYDRSRAEIN